jgi:hypothetical protein
VGPPRAAALVERVEEQEAAARLLVEQVVGGSDTGDPGADDEHVDVLDGGGVGAAGRSLHRGHLELLAGA